jgi:hypothetical protein
LHDDESIECLIDIFGVEIRPEEASFTEVGYGPI